MLRVATLAGVIVALGVAANFTSLKTPNDGVYYVAAARALVDTGLHVDATVVPHGPPITRQNGIVYALAGMMLVAGDAWPVAYTVVVAALWAWAVLAMARFYGALTGDGASGANGYLPAVITLLQYDLLNDSTSFMNEGLYAPVLFALAAEVCRRLVSVSTRAQVAQACGAMPRALVLASLTFILTGMFFRNQHVVLLPLAAVALALAGRWLLALVVPLAALAAFAAYAAFLPAPVTDGYFATLLSADSIEASDPTYALAFFTGPLSLTKVLPYEHPVAVIAGLTMAALVVVGLLRMWRHHPFLAAALTIYIIGTVVFLVLLPFVSTRYYALANLALVAALSRTGPFSPVEARRAGPSGPARHIGVRLIVAVSLGLTVATAYAWSYFSGTKPEQAYPQLVAHQRAAPLMASALVYSSQPRMVWWILGRPACAAPPGDCAAAVGVAAGASPVFIGRDDELEGQGGLRGYRIVQALTAPVEGYAAWSVAAQ